MSQAIINFFQNLHLSDELLVFIVSLFPIVELRGAIPVGFVLGMNPWILYILAIVGNLLPIPFILLLIRPLIRWFLKTKYGAGLACGWKRRWKSTRARWNGTSFGGFACLSLSRCPAQAHGPAR